MVKALHAADIEVILDVVYNHTAEGDQSGPVYSFKGIDNSTYYLMSGRPGAYENFSGTGNTLHCSNRYVRKMIVDSMRYWVKEMHVDGFRFDLASVFTRNDDGSFNLEDPPIFGDIRLRSRTCGCPPDRRALGRRRGLPAGPEVSPAHAGFSGTDGSATTCAASSEGTTAWSGAHAPPLRQRRPRSRTDGCTPTTRTRA